MALFNSFDNKYFQTLGDLINDMVASDMPMSEKELLRRIRSTDFDEPYPQLEDALLHQANDFGAVNLFTQNEHGFSPTINEALPIRPRRIELQWLSQMINDPRIRLQLDATVTEKTKDMLDGLGISPVHDIWIRKNIDTLDDDADDASIRETMSQFLSAIRNKRLIHYEYMTAAGKQIKSSGRPYRVEYSVRSNRYMGTILIWDEKYEVHRVIKVILSNLSIHDTAICPDELSDKKIDLFYTNMKNNQTPLILELIPGKEKFMNVLDRCFHILSCHDRSAYLDREKDRYLIRIKYYDFDKHDLIRDILSLGEAVIILEPQDLRDEIIGIIKNQLNLSD